MTEQSCIYCAKHECRGCLLPTACIIQCVCFFLSERELILKRKLFVFRSFFMHEFFCATGNNFFNERKLYYNNDIMTNEYRPPASCGRVPVEQKQQCN